MSIIKNKHILLGKHCLNVLLQLLAGEQVDSQLQKQRGKDDIEIEHVNGKAKIVGWDKELVQVKGELNEKAEKLIFERTSNGILIVVVEMPRNASL